MNLLKRYSEDNQKIWTATILAVVISMAPLVLATMVMAIIDDNSGPKPPYDMIHGGLTAICFFVCAFVSSKLTRKSFGKQSHGKSETNVA